MDQSDSTIAQQIAQAAMAFEQQTTGRLPGAVTVVMSEDTIVITLRGTFSPAERALAKSEEGAAQLRELHRQLFATASDPLWRQVRQITEVEVREATAEVDTSTGTVVQVLTMAQAVPAGSWSENVPGSMSRTKEFEGWSDDGGAKSRCSPEEG